MSLAERQLKTNGKRRGEQNKKRRKKLAAAYIHPLVSIQNDVCRIHVLFVDFVVI